MSGEYAKVQAETLNPLFVDVYGAHGAIGGTYNPTVVGEWGYMAVADAETAQTAGDVSMHRDHTPIELERALAGVPVVRVHFSTPGIVHILPGTFDGGANGTGYTITVTMAIDGGGDLTAQTTAAPGAKSETVAENLASAVVSGVTLTQDIDLNDVIFAPDSGTFTKFEVAMVDAPL